MWQHIVSYSNFVGMRGIPSALRRWGDCGRIPVVVAHTSWLNCLPLIDIVTLLNYITYISIYISIYIDCLYLICLKMLKRYWVPFQRRYIWLISLLVYSLRQSDVFPSSLCQLIYDRQPNRYLLIVSHFIASFYLKTDFHFHIPQKWYIFLEYICNMMYQEKY